MKQIKNQFIIIFPYFSIDELNGIEIDGFHIKPAYMQSILKENALLRFHLLNIAKIFKYGNNYQIAYFSYSIFEYKNTKQYETLKEKLNKLISILRFSQICDLKGFTSYDNFNYFLFDLYWYRKTELENKRIIYHYKGMVNGESEYDFNIENNTAQKPYISYNVWMPYEITAKSVIEHEYIKKFYYVPDLLFKGNELAKILRAIEWFNRSFSHYGRGVDLSEAILDIHTALESLLKPTEEKRGVEVQLKTSIFNFLGHSEELNTWFEKFWKLRNSIVHGDIKPESFVYIHPKSIAKKGHKHQLYLARKVFVGCLNAILKLRSEHLLLGFDEELISNEVRINEAIKSIKKNKRILKKIVKDNTFKYISSLRHDDLSTSKEKTKELGRLLLPIIKDDLKNLKPAYKDAKLQMESDIDKILASKIKDIELTVLYSDLEHNYPLGMQNWKNFSSELSALRSAAHRFFNFASWRLMPYYD